MELGCHVREFPFDLGTRAAAYEVLVVIRKSPNRRRRGRSRPARAFLQRKSSVLVRLVLLCLGLLKTPPKVVSTAFTIDSSGNRRI
jgi:hypothetical protein